MLDHGIIGKPEIDEPKGRRARIKDALYRSLQNQSPIPGGHIASLNLARFIASFLIIVGHVDPFYYTATYSGNPFVGFILYGFFHFRRLGLPFFLMTSGFLYSKSLKSGKPLIPRFIKAFNRLSIIFVGWSVFYIFEPFNNLDLMKDFADYGVLKSYYWYLLKLEPQPFLWLISGTKGHLWFLPALITSIGIITLFLHFKKQRYLLWLTMGVYLMTVCLFQTSKNFFPNPELYEIFKSYCQSFSYVGAGWWLSQQKRFSVKDAYKLITIAAVFQIAQNLLLWNLYQVNPLSTLSIGLLPALIGIFILIMNFPNFGNSSLLHRAGSMTLGIYVMHPLFIDLFDYINGRTEILNETMRDLVYPIAIIAGCLILSNLLSRIKFLKRYVS